MISGDRIKASTLPAVLRPSSLVSTAAASRASVVVITSSPLHFGIEKGTAQSRGALWVKSSVVNQGLTVRCAEINITNSLLSAIAAQT